MRVFGIQVVLSTEEQGLWWDTDMHHAFEDFPDGKPGWGIKIAFRGGNVVHPMGVGDPLPGDTEWKDNKWWNPKRVFKFFMPIPILPFLSVALGNYGFYIGFKDYPLHHDNYKRWLPSSAVYSGARALCASASIRKTRAT